MTAGDGPGGRQGGNYSYYVFAVRASPPEHFCSFLESGISGASTPKDLLSAERLRHAVLDVFAAGCGERRGLRRGARAAAKVDVRRQRGGERTSMPPQREVRGVVPI